MPSLADLKLLLPRLAAAAQAEYDAWEQDDDGYDEELGEGGICHLIAERMVEALDDAGFEAVSVHSEGIGENHVWVVAKTDQGVMEIDIPPSVYESGSGYVWKKKADVTITADDVSVTLLDRDPEKFPQYAGEDYDNGGFGP
jgi:hypothetical protein